MKEFKISEQEAQQILNYLSTCPYGQVYQFVAILIGLEEIKEQKNGNSK